MYNLKRYADVSSDNNKCAYKENFVLYSSDPFLSFFLSYIQLVQDYLSKSHLLMINVPPQALFLVDTAGRTKARSEIRSALVCQGCPLYYYSVSHDSIIAPANIEKRFCTITNYPSAVINTVIRRILSFRPLSDGFRKEQTTTASIQKIECLFQVSVVQHFCLTKCSSD